MAQWGQPMTTRSRIALEIACHIVEAPDEPLRQAKVRLRTNGAQDWPVCLFGSSTVDTRRCPCSSQLNERLS